MTILSHFMHGQSTNLKSWCIVKIIQDVIEGLQSLHSKLITHGNIDSESIFIVLDDKVKTYIDKEIYCSNHSKLKTYFNNMNTMLVLSDIFLENQLLFLENSNNLATEFFVLNQLYFTALHRRNLVLILMNLV